MRSVRAAVIVTAIAVVTAQASSIAPVAAQTVKETPKADAKGKAAAPAPKREASELQRLVDNGIASYEAGRTELAVQQLTGALSGGSLPTPLLARALYYRGAAYRKQNKPALAIADLTSALWLKGGLTDSERKEAIQERSAAYRDAGLPDQAVQTAAKSAAQPDKEETSTPASGNFFSSLFGGGSGGGAQQAAEAAPPPARKTSGVETASVASRTPPATATAGWQTSTQQRPGTTAAAAPTAPAPAATAPQSAARSATAPQAATAAPAPQRTAAAAPPPPASAPKGWATNTATASGTAAVAAAPAVATGPSFRVQIATMRTKLDAESLAAQLQSELARDIGSRRPEVVETAGGSLGTIWRVRVGPFAEIEQSQALCAKVRNRGHDCMIVRE
jgi:hypothetical protein